MVVGVPVRDDDVLELARLLHEVGLDDTAEVLVVALEAEQILVALTIQDREAILRVLDDPPASLAELRGVLLAERAFVLRAPTTGSAEADAAFEEGASTGVGRLARRRDLTAAPPRRLCLRRRKRRLRDARQPQSSRRRCSGARPSRRRATRSMLEKALGLGAAVVALRIDDRERILWALDDVRTDALAELRATLLQEHEWRQREGLL